MEAAITIPNEVFQRAEDLAERFGWTRNELFTRAAQALLEKHEAVAEPSPEIVRRWQEFYAQEDSSLDPVVMQMQLTALDEEEW